MGLLTDTTVRSDGWCSTSDQLHSIGETILFVEDEAFVRNVTCEILESAGYRVLVAKNAIEAECLYDAHCGDVDLLLTDVVLPGESGLILAACLKRRNPRLEILFATGYPEQMQSEMANRGECLAKPFSSTTLLRSVRTRLEVHLLESEGKIFPTPTCGNRQPAESAQEYLTVAVCG